MRPGAYLAAHLPLSASDHRGLRTDGPQARPPSEPGLQAR